MDYIDLADIGLIQIGIVFILLYMCYKVNYKHLGVHPFFSIAGIGLLFFDFVTIKDLFVSDFGAGIFCGCIAVVFIIIPIVKFLMYIDKI